MKTVLVVDDSQFALNSMSRLLRNHYTVLTASDGVEAIKIIKEKYPDIILLDVLMPNMHGLECCAKLKADPDTRHIPVIFLTSMADSQTEILSLKAGARDYITKPFNADVLLLRINNLIGVE